METNVLVGASLWGTVVAVLAWNPATRAFAAFLAVYTPILVLAQRWWTAYLLSDVERRRPKPNASPVISGPLPSSPSVVGSGSTLDQKNAKFIKHCHDALDTIFTQCTNDEGWKERLREDDIVVSSMQLPSGKQIFRGVATVECSPKALFDLYRDVEGQLSWNLAIKSYRIVEVLNTDKSVDVTHSVATPVGPVSSRDFIHVRGFRLLDGGGYLLGGNGLESHPLVPVDKDIVRGMSGPGGYVILPHKDKPDTCQVKWVLNSDLRGWLPRSLIEMTLSGVLRDSLKTVRQKVKT